MLEARELAERIRQRRTMLGLTQSELAARAGTSTPTIARIEGGAGGNVAFETMIRILTALGYSMYIEEGVPLPETSLNYPDIEQYLDERYFSTHNGRS